MNHTFCCGAAKQKITPSSELLPNLRGLQDRRFGGILDDLYLRVLALKKEDTQFLFITFELDKVPHPQRFLELLEKETGTPGENIFLAAVHTHTAPITGSRPFEGPNNIAAKPKEVQNATHAYENILEKTLLEACLEALGKMVHARLGLDWAESYINVYRNQWYEYRDSKNVLHRKYALGANPQIPVDRKVFVMKFEDYSGNPLAFLINYPVHCCVLHTCQCFDGKLGISGDIAGRVSQFMENEYDGSVALWCSGAAGDINPVMQNEVYYPDPATGEPVTEIMPGDNRSLLSIMANRHFDDVRRIAAGISCTSHDLSLAGCVEWSETPGMDGSYQVRLQMIRLGSVLLLGASGELYSSYARLLKSILPEQNLILVNHVASLCANSGYILDDEALLAPESDLPGVSHTNMKPGFFAASLIRHTRHMYEILRQKSL